MQLSIGALFCRPRSSCELARAPHTRPRADEGAGASSTASNDAPAAIMNFDALAR